VGLNRQVAARLAAQRLAEWRQLGYDDWCAMLNDRELRQAVVDDGKLYNIVSYALNEGDGRVRLVVAVDDGGWSAMAPLTLVEIMRSDGTFLH